MFLEVQREPRQGWREVRLLATRNRKRRLAEGESVHIEAAGAEFASLLFCLH